MNRRILPCLFLCALLLLAGCSPVSYPNITEMLRAPALGHEQGEVQKALSDYLGVEPEYKFPKEGSWRSPYIMADLDGRGGNEYVLLYSLPATAAGADKSANVYIAVLEQQDGVWTVTQDMEGPYTEVASLQVANLFGDNTRQLIVGFTSPSLNTKTFTLYKYENSVLLPMKRTPYSRYELADFSGAGNTELAIVTPFDQSTTAELWYLPVEEGKFLETPVLKLDANLASCEGLYPGEGADGERILIIDATDVNGMTVSLIAHFTGQHFYFATETSAQMSVTSRKNPLLRARDVDSDGIVEIPLRKGNNEISTLAGDKHLEYVEWMDFTGESPQRKQFGVLDSDRGVYIRLPETFEESARVRDGARKGEWLMENIQSLEPLFTVRELSAGETPPPDALLLSRTTNAYLVFNSGIKSVDRGIIKAVQMI